MKKAKFINHTRFVNEKDLFIVFIFVFILLISFFATNTNANFLNKYKLQKNQNSEKIVKSDTGKTIINLFCFFSVDTKKK